MGVTSGAEEGRTKLVQNMAGNFRQEMPPAGGFGPIEWGRKASRKRMGGYQTFALVGGVAVIAYAHYKYEKRKIRVAEFEMREGRIALEPLLSAERNRLLLKALVINREEERELMKGVKGWEVGTLYGSPVYHNKVRFPYLTFRELYAHQPFGVLRDRMEEKLKH